MLLCKLKKKQGKNGSYLIGDLGNCFLMIGKPDPKIDEYHVIITEKPAEKPEKAKEQPVMPPTEDNRDGLLTPPSTPMPDEFR